MKTLEAFWHWVDNEKPEHVLDKQLDTLTTPEQRALGLACVLVGERVGVAEPEDGCYLVSCGDLDSVRDHWPAVRDLSLAICRGLEAMHEAVPEPEALTVATPQDERDKPWYLREYRPETGACPGCKNQPCSGTHMNCDMARYMRENPDKARDVLGSPPPLQDWIPAKLADMPGSVLGRPVEPGDGLQLLRSACDQERAHAALFRREYLGEWVTAQQREIEQSQRNTEIQLAAVQTVRFATRGQAVIQGVDLGREPGRTVVIRSDQALGVNQSFEMNEREFIGQTRSNYDPVERCLEIFTTLTVSELDSFRGIKPRTIILRGEPHDYSDQLQHGIACLLSPLLMCAAINTPECKQGLAAWGL